MHQRILVVEDDADIAESLEYNLQRAGFRPVIAESGEKGLHLALDKRNRPKLIILDLMLPGMSGMELCRRIRRETTAADTPIIMLTAKSAEADRIAGLNIGADDYIVKPFSVKELIARVNAVLRRSEKEETRVYRDKKLTVDLDAMRVECEGKPVQLTRKEFSLLEHLINNIGRVALRQQLLDSVWGYSYMGDSRTLDVHIRRLRQKLGNCGSAVETVIGTGYKFVGCK
ncbi:MAG TPA: response regulator transcription factor [Pyrinomonadaceae bacterium]|nr:response regulator transcription factor [Pyrinomonadaceae bacterium]